MLAGRKAAPRSNEFACHDSIIHNGSDGSMIAMPKLPIVIAPSQILIIFLDYNVFKEIPAATIM